MSDQGERRKDKVGTLGSSTRTERRESWHQPHVAPVPVLSMGGLAPVKDFFQLSEEQQRGAGGPRPPEEEDSEQRA